MSEDQDKTLPNDVLNEIKSKEHLESGKDVSEMAESLEGKIPTKKKDD